MGFGWLRREMCTDVAIIESCRLVYRCKAIESTQNSLWVANINSKKSASVISSATDYRAELNDQQYEAVTSGPGPALVLAGAGSGKTRTLTYRVAWLLDNGVEPGSILLLTFTNKAAREMLARVAELLPLETRAIWGGTFHSIGNRLLRRHARDRAPARISIMDRED